MGAILRIGLLLVLSGLPLWAIADAPGAGSQPSIAQLDAAAAQAKQRVIAIVNKPIVHLPRTDEATVFSPGWFHPGAIKPDFKAVDVRATQELPYAGDRYVTSDVNPTEMFNGSDLEFNSMTKYFYVDRSLPKARLSDNEMAEINSLYRIVGRDEDARADQWRRIMTLVVSLCGGGAVALASFVLFRKRTSAQES